MPMSRSESLTKAAIAKAVQDTQGKLGKGHWHGECEGKRLCGKIDGLEWAGSILLEELQKLVKLEEDETDE